MHGFGLGTQQGLQQHGAQQQVEQYPFSFLVCFIPSCAIKPEEAIKLSARSCCFMWSTSCWLQGFLLKLLIYRIKKFI
jgi:hypothetical protein